MTPIDQLRATKKKLPLELREQILALRAAAVLPLIAILGDEQLGMSESPAEGWPPIHAVELLADLKATEAIEPMLDVLVETTFDHVINSNLVLRLPEFGAAALEPTLLRLGGDYAEEDVAHALVAVLAKLGIRDERIFDAICDVFDEDLVFGAMYLADYGDDRALPMIEDAIAEFEPDFSRSYWRHDLTELVDAHQQLGGVLGGDLQAHVDALDESWKQHVASSNVGGQKPGRNDPCPCRSGKKYKKCCLGRAAGPSMVASPGVSREQLTLADDDLRQNDARRGPARQFLVFAQPLLDSTDGSKAETQRALALAQLLWNVALTPDSERREAMLGDLLRDITPDAEREATEEIARDMLQRHREMFPELRPREG